MTDESSAPTASTAASGPSVPAVTSAPAAEAAAPVYRSRREMRAAGGYLQERPAATPGGAPESVAMSTSSVPIVSAPPADYAAPDISLPSIEAPTSRRALRHAEAAVAASTGRASHEQHAPSSRPATRATRPEKAPRDVDSSQRRAKLRDRLGAAGVMVLVGGLFVPLALPAYADAGAGGVATASVRAQGSQALGVDASLDKTSTARDDYSATSAEDLRALYASALRQKNLSAYLLSGSASKGNDYPWPDQLSRNQGGGLSPLGYYYRECVDFVAWRLNRDAGSSAGGPYRWTWSSLTPSGGNASQWKSAWLNHGWATGTTAQVGAVAWFPGQNHVAYVSGILASGQIVIDEYNMGGQHEYDQRVIDPSTVEFLYAPPA